MTPMPITLRTPGFPEMDSRGPMTKTVNKTELLARAGQARAAGQTIVHCHGCFDIVHPGHIRYLEFARQQGDVLVVSLTGDSEVTKGAQRPYIPQELRAENLAALQAVDLVYINPYPNACELIAELKPDVYVKGREYEQGGDPGFAAEREVVAGYGGRVLFSSGDVVFSSSRLIEALRHQPDLEAERLALICRRHHIDHDAIESLLRRFATLRVLVVGDLILDRYVLCDATELAAEAPMMSLTQLEERTYVGGAGIVARHVAALGGTAYLLSAAAADEPSCQARQVLETEGVNTELIACRPRLPEKTRYLVETNKILRVENGTSHPLDSVAERQAVDWVSAIAPDIDAVVLCDFGYGTMTKGLLGRALPILGGSGRTIAADASGPRGGLLNFKNVTLLCPTERTLRSALHDFERGLSNVAWHALEETQARHMLVTLGTKGLVTFDRQSQDATQPDWRGRLRSEYLPALAETMVDLLGTDTALLAAGALALAAGGTLMQAAYLAMAAFAIEGARLGNEPISLNSLRQWLAGRLELTRAARRPPREVVRFGAGPSQAVNGPEHRRTRIAPTPEAAIREE